MLLGICKATTSFTHPLMKSGSRLSYQEKTAGIVGPKAAPWPAVSSLEHVSASPHSPFLAALPHP